MAVVDILTPTTSAASSSEFVCDGIAEITVGLYGTIQKRVGATVMIEGSGGFEPYRDDRGRLVILTQSAPQTTISSAGNYRVDKPATLAAVGAWEDPGGTGGGGGGGGDYVPWDVGGATFNASSATVGSAQAGTSNFQSGYNNQQAGLCNTQSGYSGNQTGAYSIQSGYSNTSSGYYCAQFGYNNDQSGSYTSLQAGMGNTQSGQYGFQVGQALDDNSRTHTAMFGQSKTATVGHRAYFSLDNGIWLKPVTAPLTPEAGVVYYDSGTNKLRVYTGAGWETVTSV